MKKKLLQAMTLFILSTVVFAGCTPSGTTAPTAPTASTSSASGSDTSSEPTEEQVVLKWYTDTDEIANKTLYKTQEIADEFTKQNPKILVEVQPLIAATSTSDYLQKVDLMLASGEKLDIVYFSGANGAYSKILSKSILPLDDFSATRNIDLATEYTNSLAFEGKHYTLAREDSVYITFLNKDLLDAAGLPIPPLDWTWADYAEYAKKLTAGEGPNKIWGSYLHTWETMFQMGYFPDTRFYKEDGSSNFDNPAFGEFLALRYQMEQVDKTSTPLADIKTQNLAYRNMFFNGQVAMMPQGAWLLGDIKDLEKYPHDFKTTITSLPRLTTDQKPNATIGSGGSGYAITSHSEHPQEAFDLIYFITTWGADYNKSRISAWSNSDRESIAKSVMGEDESLYDYEAFERVMDDIYQIQPSQFPEYNTEILNLFMEECEMGVTGVQTIDETVEKLVKRSNEIIDKNK